MNVKNSWNSNLYKTMIFAQFRYTWSLFYHFGYSTSVVILQKLLLLSPSAMSCVGNAARPMLTQQRKENMGGMYRYVGSHSAVKLCRWQKSMLRGRGGCYKSTFYGIKSHQCMEATPSMACANKCTFCWRHNTNPTAKEWKWDMDNPVSLVKEMIDAHIALVKNSGGVPGVTPDRLCEGLNPRHCALSLVGEPILYPKVNELIGELHRRNVSTFLVNNGQFPDQLASLRQVTQLYLSVDAHNALIMKEVGRPVFPDYWQRFQRSLDVMRDKAGRTVLRMTMIKGVNLLSEKEDTEPLEGYAECISKAWPCFVELKALTPTFQGDGSHKPFRMNNVPSYSELLHFAHRLANHAWLCDYYSVVCGHEHSNCVLLAHKKFLHNGEWHTWIEYDKFHILANNPGIQCIRPEEYWAVTPKWSLVNAEEKGFDPSQTRHRKGGETNSLNH